MGDVVEMADYTGIGHAAGDCRCLACRHEWQGTISLGSVWLDCPACGLHKGMFIYPHGANKDTDKWECGCGCDVFFITRDHTRCCHCGLPQTFPPF